MALDSMKEWKRC